MKKRIVIGLGLLILLTTITSQQKIVISKFNLKEINIENNILTKKKDIKKLLFPIYNKNLIFLKNLEIEKALMQNSFIESFEIKKKYPNTLSIKIFEKKPIAILQYNKNKFYLSEKIELIKFENLSNYQNLPYVIGSKEDFEIFYNSLNKINFPFDQIKKYTLYESKRWDLETVNNKLIRLPAKDYIKSIKNYLNLINNNDFKKYKLFDYRINNQLILN
tara:strand:- start:154 stop:810 length:657 start_codon:yes stop_codon:yes gene_type:complete